jgi:hypothetical protein
MQARIYSSKYNNYPKQVGADAHCSIEIEPASLFSSFAGVVAAV